MLNNSNRSNPNNSNSNGNFMGQSKGVAGAMERL